MNEVWARVRQLSEQEAAVVIHVARAVIIVIIMLIVYRALMRGLATLRTTDRLSLHADMVLRRLAFWGLILCGTMIVLQQLGLMQNAWTTLTALLAVIGVGFVAVWSVLSNTLCSVILMVSRPFNVGDTIEITVDKLRGEVVDFSLIFTTLRDEEGHLIQIPNNTFFQKAIRREIGARTVPLNKQDDRERPANEHAS